MFVAYHAAGANMADDVVFSLPFTHSFNSTHTIGAIAVLSVCVL